MMEEQCLSLTQLKRYIGGHCSLQKWDVLTHAVLTHAVLNHAVLTHAVLTHDVLTHAVLTHAVLTHAVLTHAVLLINLKHWYLAICSTLF